MGPTVSDAKLPESEQQIRLRKISSMDGSDQFASLEQKRVLLKEHHRERIRIPIPTYPKSKPFRNGFFSRMWARWVYFSAILRQKMSGREYPLIVVLVVNNKCNWNCTYCFGDYPNRMDIDYTTDEIKYLVDELYAMGCRYINMHGGETLLRQDVGELVNYIKNKGIYIGLITNGQLLPRKIDEVRAVDSLTISLDGRPENNDKVRGAGTYEMSLAAIRLAVQNKIPLRVSATLTRHTMNDVEFLAKLARAENFQLYFSILFKPLKKAQDAQMSNEEIRHALTDIRKWKHMGYPIFTSDPVLDAAYEWPYDFNETHHITEKQITPEYRKHHIECFYSRTKFTIEADGYIYPCFLTTDGSFSPKNWREVGLGAAIEHAQKRNTCKACPALSQNDHNALLGISLRQVGHVLVSQLKEAFRANRI